MVKLVIVGDEPSKTNVSTDVAFVGAKCFPTVVAWIKRLNPDYYVCLNSDTISQLSDIKKLYGSGFKVLALGSKASERLDKMNIVHMKMPHPSPLNRQINDKKYIDRELQVCYDFLHDTKVGILSANCGAV